MRLFVDDQRAPPPGWALARTVKEAIEMLGTGSVEEVSLDFVIGGGFEHDNFAPVARRIAEMPEEARPRRVRIHTSSASGARELERILSGRVKFLER